MAKKPKAPKLQEATPKLGGAFAGQQYFYNEKGEVVDQTGAVQTPVQLAKIKPFLNEYDPNYGKVAPKPVRRRQIRRPIQPAPVAPVAPVQQAEPAEELVTPTTEPISPSATPESAQETPKGKKPGLMGRAAGNAKTLAKFAGRKFLQSSFPQIYGLHQEYQAYKKKNRTNNLKDQEEKTKADNTSSENKRSQSDIKAGLDYTNTLMKDSGDLIRQSLAKEERITTLLSEISSTLTQIKWLLILKGKLPSLGGGLPGAGLGAGALGVAALPLAVGGVLLGLGVHRKMAQEADPEGADVFDRTISSGSKRAETINGPEAEQKANPNVDVSRKKLSPVDFLIKNGLAKTEAEAKALIDYIKGDIIVLKDGRWWDNKEQILHAAPAPIDKNGKKVESSTTSAAPAYAAGTAPVNQSPAAPRNALADLNQTTGINAAKENTLEKARYVNVETDDLLFKSSKITFDTQKFILDAKSVEKIKNENPRDKQGATPAVAGGGNSPGGGGGGATPAASGSETTPGGGGSGSTTPAAGSGPQPPSATPQVNGEPTATPGPGAPAGGAPTQPAGGKYDEAGLIALMKQAGATDEEAKVFAKIAIRESSGVPTAHNDNSRTGDDSYGLWQINMIGRMGPDRLRRLGLTDPKQLLDPLINAKAALMLKRGQMGPGPAGWKPWRGRGDNSMLPREDNSSTPAATPTPGPTSENNDPAATPTPGPTSENNDPAQQLRQQRQSLAELRDTGFSRTRAFADGTEDNGSFFRKEYETNPQYRENQKKQGRFLDDKLLGGAGQDFQQGNYGSGLLGLGGAALNFIPGIGPVVKGVAGQGIDFARDRLKENTKQAPGPMPKAPPKSRLPKDSAKAAAEQQQRDPQFKLPPSRMSQWNQTKNPSAMHDQNIQRSYRVHDPAGKISREVGF